MKIRKLDPAYGDQVLELAPQEATEFIMNEKKEGRLGFVKFSDGDILDMMNRTGILEQLQEKESDGTMATIVPHIAGG